MATSRDRLRCLCTFPANAFEAAASESNAFVGGLPGRGADPQRAVTLVIRGGQTDGGDFFLQTKLAVACHSLKLRKRVRADPAVTEIAVPSELSSRAVEALFHLIEHHELNLSCPELEPLCAATDELNVPSVHAALRQAAKSLLAAAECHGPACVQALLQDLVRLGSDYRLPELVDLGVVMSLSLVPKAAQAAHFRAMPAEVQNSPLMRQHLALLLEKERSALLKKKAGSASGSSAGWSFVGQTVLSLGVQVGCKLAFPASCTTCKDLAPLKEAFLAWRASRAATVASTGLALLTGG